MTAYGDLTFLFLAGVLAIPAMALGLAGRRMAPYGMLATAIGTLALVAGTPQQGLLLAGFLAFQAVLARAHLAFIGRRGRTHAWERRLAVALALAPLVAVKATGFVHLSGWSFIGVSYLTFRALQVIIETSDGLIKAIPLARYWYFLAFFPALASGPIDRSRRFDQDVEVGYDAASYSRLLGRGLWLLLLGAFYKVALAGWFAEGLKHVGSDAVGLVATMYLYGFNLFFDFAGYSHMAVGLSFVFGIRTPTNFRLPFVAESIKDFWNRWHISLSFWFRDFLYTRLLMALLKRKVFASKHAASYVAYLVNMMVMGLWHGTALHFVLYGLYHGGLLVATDFYERTSRLHARLCAHPAYRVARIAVTFHLVMFGFMIFSGKLISI